MWGWEKCKKYGKKDSRNSCPKQTLVQIDIIGFRARVSSVYNKDLSTPGQSRVCSNPCYIYYYDDETIPFQAFLCKFGFWLFFMKFYETNFRKNLEKILINFLLCPNPCHIFRGINFFKILKY